MVYTHIVKYYSAIKDGNPATGTAWMDPDGTD